MEDFKVRLLEERNQLKDRFEKLDTFIQSETFDKLELELQVLMEDQLGAMSDYLYCLWERIRYYGLEEDEKNY